MSDNSLPDEIISEILSPALKVCNDVFSDTSNVSPFATYSESSSAYLLVCKAWLRVATPLLYNTVILRSKAQAKALEGGYGPSMATILECSPNISDLFLSFQIWATDNVDGLCEGLPLINPTHFILQDDGERMKQNKIALKLEDALTNAISKWDRLLIVDLPYSYYYYNRARRIVKAIAKSRRLQTVVVSNIRDVAWVYDQLKKCLQQVIHIKQPISKSDWSYLTLVKVPFFKALARFTEAPSNVETHNSGQISVSDLPHIAPSLNPSFIPMNSATNEVKEIVWKRILYFAVFVPQLSENPNIAPRLPLLLRLALPYFYAYTMVKDSAASSKFLRVLQKNPSIAPEADPPDAALFCARKIISSLVKIKLNPLYWSKSALHGKWDIFFIAFEPKYFPNLREIEVTCCEWPTTEREIDKSCWVPWAEILLEKNINLTDKNGKKWRRRLK
ncbi:hypothetical protein C8R44DRAFT_878607 [Mycena epipterygia]|nr:hypothetical protein C8R44DRAFT_878607 [Mycena epipterygia]